MADLVLSPVIDRLVKGLAAYLGDQYSLRSGVGRKLTDLKESLLRLQAVTTVAEEVDTNNKPLAAWRMQLKEAVYDAEDVIDEFDYRRLERQAIDAQKSKVTNFFNPRKVLRKFSSSPLKKLQKIQNRLDKLAMSTGDFLQLINSEHCTRWAFSERSRETTSFNKKEPIFVGRSEVMEEIINQLVEVGEGTSRIGGEVPAVLIVGPGGFGKSTLARNVFHDNRVDNLFELRMWVHVSQNFDLKRLTKAMIDSASRKESNNNVEKSLERLQQDLKEVVGSRKFLLVLDDMWCGQDMLKMEENWRCLLAPLAGGRGSAILLTTRTEELKVLPGTYPPLVLNPLEDDECWSIICANTFCNGEIPDGHEDLVEIGKKIAVKLKGSPIAAKAISGVLRNNLEGGYWRRILDTGIGELQDVMDVLRLSYRHLPPHLRQCFAYCSLFPKGFKFFSDEIYRTTRNSLWFRRSDVKDIGRMWVAQGFIRPKDGESVDEAGRRCFNDLLSRSFFQKLDNDDNGDAYVMHDLMNDLARQVSQGDCLGFERESLPKGKISETVRHICITTKDQLTQLKIRGCNLRNLRSILVLYPKVYMNDDIWLLFKELLGHLHQVRVLHVLSLNGDVRLPDDVGDWIHLRYLCVNNYSQREPQKEPQSFYRLYKLQVLNMDLYIHTRKFQRKVSNLTNLQVLGPNRFFNDKSSGFQGPAYLGRLTNLEVLTCPFHVTRESGCDFRQLKTLDKLGARLDIRNLENIESKEEAEVVNLQDKRLLESLFLTWGNDFNPRDTSSLPKDVGVLEALRPPSSLKSIMIGGFEGSECPSWMHNNWLSNLTVVTLQSLRMLVQLPRLGELPLLETLRLFSLFSVRKIGGHDFYGEKATYFPSLKKLVIQDMAMLEEWSRPEGDGLCFPNLQIFSIQNCPKLSSLPWVIGSQKHISLPPSSLKISGHDFYGEKATSFPSLKKLVIEDMAIFEEWSRPESDGLCFPNLEVLRIQKCPRLSSLPWVTGLQKHGNLPPSSLKILDINECRVLACDISCSPYLQSFPNLSSLRMHKHISLLQTGLTRALVELIILDCEALTPMGLVSVLSLATIKLLGIKGCPGLFAETSSPAPTYLTESNFSSSLETLVIDELLLLITVPILKTVSSLRRLCVTGSFEGAYFPPKVEDFLHQNCCTLSDLVLCSTPFLLSLPANLDCMSFLQSLYIYDAPELQSLPVLPHFLTVLNVAGVNAGFRSRYQKEVGSDWLKVRHIGDFGIRRWMSGRGDPYRLRRRVDLLFEEIAYREWS